MKTDTVTVGGLPGSGTSTLCRILKDRLGLPYIYAGQIFRDEAARRGMSLAAFGALCEADRSVDEALDARQVALLRQGHVLLEGRLSGKLAIREGLEAFTVWVECDPGERLRRVTERDGGTMDAQRTAMRAREASEAARYRRYYGIDLGDVAGYDLVVDSTRSLPDALADRIVTAMRADP